MIRRQNTLKQGKMQGPFHGVGESIMKLLRIAGRGLWIAIAKLISRSVPGRSVVPR